MTGRVTIIGGGVVGLCSGLALARDRWNVRIVDAGHDDDAAASWGNAGHIAIEQVAPLASWPMIRSAPGRLFVRGGALALPPRQIGWWLPFALRMAHAAAPARFAEGRDALKTLMAEAVPAWRALVAGLGATDLLREDGHFVAWGDPASAARGRAGWAAADTGTARFRDADADERALLRRIGGAAGAIRFENSAQVTDLRRLRAALRAGIVAAGGTITGGRASLALEDERAIVTVDGERVESERVLVAGGARSGGLLAPIGHRVPIVGERGYHLRSADHDWPAGLPPVAFEDRSLIVTRYDDCVQVASFVEPGDPDAPPDPAKWARLEARIAELGLPIRAPFTRWMGARPTLPDYRPAIGLSRRAGNLAYAFGHQHLGLTLAPTTAQIVAALMAGRPTIPLAAFDVERFARGDRA
ncbi:MULTISPECIES: FAD-dependent oxidoreductase [unclassified Sphingomonas]|uniref:NAD(P)/FAD-dependent oxidoreductase n=1 Tax=unclassified Sphingomonas TaxID=196159 RepID=UPI00226A3B9A|nr:MULTISPECIES: FAD-dependent oxidoreductase [unclassified Sphingomonas]